MVASYLLSFRVWGKECGKSGRQMMYMGYPNSFDRISSYVNLVVLPLVSYTILKIFYNAASTFTPASAKESYFDEGRFLQRFLYSTNHVVIQIRQ
jgi:hypothetical protein